MDYEWLMEFANRTGRMGEEWEERFTSREYQEHLGGDDARQGEWEMAPRPGREREPLGLNSGENVRMSSGRVGPMGRLWRSSIEMGSWRRPSARPRLRLRSGSRPVLAPFFRRYG